MNGSVATRYANALFEEALAKSVEMKIYGHLGMLYSSMKAEAELQYLLNNPCVSRTEKFNLLVTASGILKDNQRKANEDNAMYDKSEVDIVLYTRFLHLVLEHGRESFLRMIVLVYGDLVREHHKIIRVIFETAVPVNETVKEKMKERVEARTGKKVECVTHVRPELIGGFRLRIGDTRYDYSFATKLENIKKRFLCQNN